MRDSLESYRIKFMARVGRLLVVEGMFSLAASMYFLLLGEYMVHGFILGLIALPQFVTGVYYHMIPGYCRRAPHILISSIPPVLSAVSMVSYILRLKPLAYISLSLFAGAVAFITYYSSRPLVGRLYHHKVTALSSYASTAIISAYAAASSEVSDVTIAAAVAYTLPVGLIYAVNSAALTYTYKLKPRGWASVLISILLLISPILLVLRDRGAFALGVIVGFILYLLMIRVDSARKWIEAVKGYEEPSKGIHLNLIYATLTSLPFLPLSLQPADTIDAVHVLLFGFVLLNIVAHGPALLPTVLKLKASRGTCFHCIILAGSAAILRAAHGSVLYYGPLSGLLVIATIVLLILSSVRFERVAR